LPAHQIFGGCRHGQAGADAAPPRGPAGGEIDRESSRSRFGVDHAPFIVQVGDQGVDSDPVRLAARSVRRGKSRMTVAHLKLCSEHPTGITYMVGLC